METLLNTGSIVLPIIVTILYVVLFGLLLKLAIYVFRLPKYLSGLESRIKELEEREAK